MQFWICFFNFFFFLEQIGFKSKTNKKMYLPQSVIADLIRSRRNIQLHHNVDSYFQAKNDDLVQVEVDDEVISCNSLIS